MDPADPSPEHLHGGFAGDLIGPHDPRYDEARRLWNGALDKHPALIARCTSADDAAAALAYSLHRNLPVSIRGGGHNVAGSAIAEGGVVIDFSGLRGVEVDPDRRIARVQPGALWSDLDTADQAHGLATPGGIVTHTGVAGLTVGGGFGWLSRRWGLSSDNLESVRMVLADGSRVRAAEDENTDLFWAVRGGGGNFGIVTEFEFRLHRLGTTVLAGPIVYPADRAREVLQHYRDFIVGASDQLSVFVALRAAPPLPWVPTELRGSAVAIVMPCWSGEKEWGEEVLRPLREFGPPLLDLVREVPYTAWQSAFDAGVPHHWGYYWKSHYLPPLTDDAVDVLVGHSWRATNPQSYTLLFHLGGAISRPALDHSAASGRDALHAININGAWPQGGPTNPDISWARDFHRDLAPHATGGVYVNFLHHDEPAERIRAAYGGNYDRLARIKATYDPDNVFRSNQNIPPALLRAS